MAYQDRPYYRDGAGTSGNPLMWLLTGSVPLFRVFGINVRAHASLVITIVLVLVFGWGPGFTVLDRVQSSTVLFLIVLLHEFGHCFAARWVGGEADEILMHPLGGLALTRPPHRPLPQFITVAGGPLVNVAICLVCGLLLWSLFGWLPWNPFRFQPVRFAGGSGWVTLWSYAYWIYRISWMLLVFNLMPIFPLDGGQMLQAMLWPKFGYYRSMNFACITGMVGAVLGGMIALATGNLMLFVLAVMGFFTCFSLRQQLKAAGPYAFETNIYSAAYEPVMPRLKKPSRWATRRAAREAEAERAEQQKIDAILAKVHANGMNSLSWGEKRALRKATERQRQREVARARRVR